MKTLEEIVQAVLDAGDTLEFLGTKSKASADSRARETRKVLRDLHQLMNKNSNVFSFAGKKQP